MKKIVVLGGKGFLGGHVMKQLAEKGHDAVALSRRSGCDILDLRRLLQRIRAEEPDVVINCAAHVGGVHYGIKYAGDMLYENVLLIAHVYRGVQLGWPQARIINPISNCTYPGSAENHYEPEWEDGPVHDSVLAYAAARRMVYAFAESFRKQYGTKSVNWLVANAYGPGDYTDPNKVHALNGIIIRLIQAQQENQRRFEIWGSGKPVREWVYIEDVARMLVHSVDHVDEQYKPINLAQSKAYSIAEIAIIAAKALDYNVEFVFNTDYPDGAPTKILDSRIFRDRHPEFRFTPLEQGIRNTISYYRSVLSPQAVGRGSSQ
jgi:GDP-L-fucose synthase